MSIRKTLAGLLEQHTPADWDVVEYMTDPGAVSRPMVMVSFDSVAPGPAQGVLLAGFNILVIIPSRDDAERNEDAVDDALPFIVDVLSRVESSTSVQATRVTFAEKYPAWNIELNLVVTITDDDTETEE